MASSNTFMGLVRFSCGCVGWPKLDAGGKALVIEHCDYDGRDVPDGGPLSPGWWPMREKAHEPLDKAAEDRLIDEIGRLLYGGYKFDALRSILRAP